MISKNLLVFIVVLALQSNNASGQQRKYYLSCNFGVTDRFEPSYKPKPTIIPEIKVGVKIYKEIYISAYYNHLNNNVKDWGDVEGTIYDGGPLNYQENVVGLSLNFYIPLNGLRSSLTLFGGGSIHYGKYKDHIEDESFTEQYNSIDIGIKYEFMINKRWALNLEIQGMASIPEHVLGYTIAKTGIICYFLE